MMDLVRFASAFVRIAQEKGPEKPPYWGAWQALSAARGKPFSGFLRLLLEAEETWPEFGRWSELAGGGAAREYWEAAQKTGTYRATTQTGEDQVLIVLFEDTLWGTMEAVERTSTLKVSEVAPDPLGGPRGAHYCRARRERIEGRDVHTNKDTPVPR